MFYRQNITLRVRGHYKRIANQIGTYIMTILYYEYSVVILAFSVQICRAVDHSAMLYNNNYGDTLIIVVSFSYFYLTHKYNDNIMNTHYYIRGLRERRQIL